MSVVLFIILFALLNTLHLHLPRVFELPLVFTEFAIPILVTILCFKKVYRYLKREGLFGGPIQREINSLWRRLDIRLVRFLVETFRLPIVLRQFGLPAQP